MVNISSADYKIIYHLRHLSQNKKPSSAAPVQMGIEIRTLPTNYTNKLESWNVKRGNYFQAHHSSYRLSVGQDKTIWREIGPDQLRD